MKTTQDEISGWLAEIAPFVDDEEQLLQCSQVFCELTLGDLKRLLLDADRLARLEEGLRKLGCCKWGPAYGGEMEQDTDNYCHVGEFVRWSDIESLLDD